MHVHDLAGATWEGQMPLFTPFESMNSFTPFRFEANVEAER